MKNVAFLLPTGTNIASLETARHGFLVANNYLAAQGREPQFHVRTLALTREVSLDEGRIKVQADLVLADAPQIDICIAPPLLGTVSDVVQSNRELIDWVSTHHRNGGEVAS
ncbi:MAG: AraC family transcriptional regulator, partial [Achromobacter spanius]